MTKNELLKNIESKIARSAWQQGVNLYAYELVESLDIPEENICTLKEETLLNGSKDWIDYSYGGCALIYDSDIAERLCTKSELAKKKNGDNPPNKQENWLDVQARALLQAKNIVLQLAKSRL